MPAFISDAMFLLCKYSKHGPGLTLTLLRMKDMDLTSNDKIKSKLTGKDYGSTGKNSNTCSHVALDTFAVQLSWGRDVIIATAAEGFRS